MLRNTTIVGYASAYKMHFQTAGMYSAVYTCCFLWLMLRQFIIIYNVILVTDQRYCITVMHV